MNQLFRPPQSQGRNPPNSWKIFKFLQLKTAQHVGLTMRWKPTKSAARGCRRRWRGFHPDAPRCCHLPEATSTDWGPFYRWSDKLWGSSARPERTGFCWWAIWWIPAETCDYFVKSQLCGQFWWVKMILISNVFTSFDSPWNALSIVFEVNSIKWIVQPQMNAEVTKLGDPLRRPTVSFRQFAANLSVQSSRTQKTACRAHSGLSIGIK